MVDYATLGMVRGYHSYESSDTDDDVEITKLITRVSAFIDRYTGRTFAPASDTTEHFEFEAVDGYDLFVGDKDNFLLSITTLLNGDGTSIASSEYFLLPRGASQYHTIRLKQASTISWQDATDGYIAVTGKWGWSTAIPADLEQACIESVLYILKGRKNISDYERPQVTNGGAMLLPKSLPKRALTILDWYRKKA